MKKKLGQASDGGITVDITKAGRVLTKLLDDGDVELFPLGKANLVPLDDVNAEDFQELGVTGVAPPALGEEYDDLV